MNERYLLEVWERLITELESITLDKKVLKHFISKVEIYKKLMTWRYDDVTDL